MRPPHPPVGTFSSRKKPREEKALGEKGVARNEAML